ncbi:MAG: hypothetical protein ABI875_00435 [Gemmatimonadales bacterium]
MIDSTDRTVCGLLALFLLAAPLHAQTPKRDSIDARRRALRAQTRFEQVRRYNLPLRFVGAGNVCDARIGRFCQWNDEDPGTPPKEPKPIHEARDALLVTLDSLAARSPNDDWIAGQRLRYLVEAGRDTAALKAAKECAGTGWWCDALKGLALHEIGDDAASDSAFRSALRGMPDAERCRWTDISILLDDAQRKRYGKVGCGKREQIAARLWWLADPFFAIAGNDRETEHYARQTMSMILDGTRAGYGIRWGDDLRQLLVRYGWSRFWTRSPGPGSDPDNGPVSGHEAAPNYHFFPESLKIDSVTDIGDTTWNLHNQYSAERYSPKIAPAFADLEPQVALFRRGDSVEVVAAYDVSSDTALAGPAVHSALVLARDERDKPLISESTVARGWHAITVDATPRVLSIETWNPEKRHGARLRRGVLLAPRKPNSVAVSDVLLFEAVSPEATDLPSILPHALGSLTVAGNRKLGLYWEMYGLARADSALPVSLTLTRFDEGIFRKLAQSIGLTTRSTPLNIAWRETPARGGVATRSVVLDLSLIPRGHYRLKLELAPAGSPPVSTTRVIDII